MAIKEWIVEWIVENIEIEKEEVLEHTRDHYIELGWMDSYTFVSFVTELEQELNQRFDERAFGEEAFMTIDGLVELIDEGSYMNEL